MKRYANCFRILVCIVYGLFICSGALKANSRPNIVLIIPDDAGYTDFWFQGSTAIKTPNLDR